MNRAGDFLLLQALEHERLLRVCLYRFVRNHADVEDLLHATYEKLLVIGAAGPPEIRSVRAFLLKIASNVALDWLRHRQVVPMELVADMAELDVLDEDARVEEIVNADQELELLRAAVAQLPRKSRQVFTLRKVHDLSQKEIAARLKISEHTVEQHLRKAARRCTEILAQGPARDASWTSELRRRWKRYGH